MYRELEEFQSGWNIDQNVSEDLSPIDNSDFRLDLKSKGF